MSDVVPNDLRLVQSSAELCSIIKTREGQSINEIGTRSVRRISEGQPRQIVLPRWQHHLSSDTLTRKPNKRPHSTGSDPPGDSSKEQPLKERFDSSHSIQEDR